ncbi:HD domain-containing protein [Halobacillus shinanisalinarum]|uniref:HD domain-containing protein n=1 Tax=Halobacillus shinanisalinarum TaxID=2932258 RepID=A0ABY4H3T1_9BACI|nr:HD domain-containing protein [Halobacillus shinanisalinarum]UOQ95110.1 HD domain-containing protein [Halobacillus shinanisalinarum]
MQKVVDFRKMVEGTKEEFEYLEKLEEGFNTGLPDRLLKKLDELKNSFSGYRISRYEHSLQSATRAYQNNEDEDMIVAALLHDIGDELAPHTHGEMVAAILKPFVSEKATWIVKHHGVFQQHYMAHMTETEKNARDIFKDNPFYQACVNFCENYDQNCFDPDFEYLPVEFFEPMVRKVFTRSPKFE